VTDTSKSALPTMERMRGWAGSFRLGRSRAGTIGIERASDQKDTGCGCFDLNLNCK
jgi:hypothetical protein